MKNEITLNFDGACFPFNPGGNMGFGVLIKDQNGFEIFANSSKVDPAPGNSNNVAEYRALIIGLTWLVENDYTDNHIKVLGDSALVINQLKGTWKARGGMYYSQYLKAKALVEVFTDINFTWVNRLQNKEADALSNTF